MRQEIALYINDKKVQFSEPPELNFVYQRLDYTNPTIVKNSYTKTVEIEGTPANNQIFNSIYHLDRVQSTYFNPSKRVPFQLYENGDLIEQGYCRLDNVRQENSKTTYELTLYGGLGDFFYELSYNESENPEEGGNTLTLGDLTYRREDNGNVIDLGFEINRNTVKAAWDRLEERSGVLRSKWDIINFCPAYNGTPDGIDGKKVLIDTNGTGNIKMRKVVDNTITVVDGFPTSDSGYTTYQGRWALGEMNEDLDEWEMKDLRSYLQRPCMSIKGLFNGIENSTKYSLDLDKSFFRYDNPYWEEAFFTLPLLTNLKQESETESVSFVNVSTTKADNYDYRLRLEGDGTLYDSVSEVSITFTPKATYKKANSYDTESERAAEGTRFYPAFYTGGQGSGRYKYGALTCQLIGFDNNGNAVAGSDIYVCTNKIRKDGQLKTATLAEMGFESVYGAAPVFDYRYFNKGSRWSTSAWDVVWYKPITLKLSTTSTDVKYVVLRMDWINSSVSKNSSPSTYRSSLSPTNGKPNNIFHAYNFVSVGANISSSNIVVSTPSSICTNTQISQKKLFSGFEHNPCEMLLSYCKLFNLYFEKDLYSDVIHIRHRSNFYDGKVINLEKKIDRSKEMNITPLSFDTKWYSFAFGDSDAANIKRYKEERGAVYGQQKVDTGYNFDSEINNLLEDNAFSNGVSVQEQSPYFHYWKTQSSDTLGLPPFIGQGRITYHLYNNVMEDKEIAITYPASATEGKYTDYGDWFDAFDKLQLCGDNKSSIDGAGVLCFFNGMNAFEDYDGEHNIIGVNTPLSYRLSDDLQTMIDLNGKPCWLYTNSDNIALNITKLPHFSRFYGFKDNTFTYIGFAWDFGFPAEIYVPNKKYSTPSTIYNRFWKGFISDLYDVNTRILECYVKMDGKVLGDWLKHFYWFDNSIWVMTKITDYNLTSFDTVKCEFAKVWSKGSYTNPIIFGSVLTITPSTLLIPASGGTITAEVYISDAGAWGSEYDGSIITANPTRSSGGVETTIVSLTFAPNEGQERQITYSVEDSYDRNVSVIFTQEGNGGGGGSELNLNPTTLNFDYDAGLMKTVSVSSTTNYNTTITDN
jgi:hypothetical protein